MPFFHLCVTSLAPGSIIEPGNFGRIVGLFGFKHQLFNREATLEEVRRQVAPEAPSRMQSVFAFQSQREAELFRFREFQGFAITRLYEIEPVDPASPIFFAPLIAIEAWQPNNTNAAAIYWGQGFKAGEGPGIDPKCPPELAISYEVLIGGQVRILKLLG